jgi:hypothetical protein
MNTAPQFSNPGRPAFDWLMSDRWHLRRNLADIERAVRQGRFADCPPEQLAALVQTVEAIGQDPTVSDRVRWRLGRVLEAVRAVSI